MTIDDIRKILDDLIVNGFYYVAGYVALIAIKDYVLRKYKAFMLRRSKVIVAGDTIEVAGHKGKVVSIGWNRIRMADARTNSDIIIPIEEFGKEIIVRYAEQDGKIEALEREINKLKQERKEEQNDEIH